MIGEWSQGLLTSFLLNNQGMIKNIYKKSFQNYKSQMQNGKFENAEKILQKIIKINPVKGWYHFGLLYPMLVSKKIFQKTVLSKQIEYFNRSLSYDKKNPATWRALGNTLFQLKKYDAAEEAYKQSLEYSRSELYKNDALRFLADILIVRRQFKKAFQILNKILHSKHRPPYIQLANHFIVYYQKIGNQKLVNYWAKKAITSAKIIEKSGKPAYGPKDTYRRAVKYFESFINKK